MREKGKRGKTKKILIRVNEDEKKLANKLSKDNGMNTSEYFRFLLKQDYSEKTTIKIIREVMRQELKRRK